MNARRISELYQRIRYGKLLDVWSGETVFIKGHRHFRMPDGRLVPAISGGGSQSWTEVVDVLTADGTQISNSTSEAILCPDFNIPAYYLSAGRALRLVAWGVNSNVVTTPGTLTLRVRWGGLAGTLMLASAAIGLDTTARTNAIWTLQAWMVCRSSGSSGTVNSAGLVNVVNVLASVGITNNGVFGTLTQTLGSAGAPIASGNANVTIDTTAAKLLSVTGQFSVATNPTNLTCHGRLLEVLN